MKVLIISHNPMSTKHSIGKTLMSLFSGFKQEELGQLYIHTGKPEWSGVSSYFQVTDKDVLKGILSRKVSCREVLPTENSTDEKSGLLYKFTYGNKKKNKPSRELLRDFMWQLSPWYNKKLKEWIKKQGFTCIFVAIGSNKFLYNIAMKISKDFGLPICTYVCDDFYFMKSPKSIIGKIWKRKLLKATRKLMKNSDKLVSISKEMSDLYAKEFNISTNTVMTGSNFEVSTKSCVSDTVTTISYFGKITLKRYESLLEIGKTLDQINLENKSSYALDVYCGEIDDDVKSLFISTLSVKFHNFISGEEFKKRFFASEILLHIESFDENCVDRTKYSVSTKIADSLASGIPMFAYGPSVLASMRHLIRNDCATVATESSQLKDKLLLILTDKQTREHNSQEAIIAANKFHNSNIVSPEIYKILSE